MKENHEYSVVDKLAVPAVLLKTLSVKKRLEANPELKLILVEPEQFEDFPES